MEFRKKVFISLCIFSSVCASVQAEWKLPSMHHQIATSQIELNASTDSPFLEEAIKSAQANSPFANMAEELRKAQAELNNPLANRMIDYAERFLGTRYRLGASGPSAFDCSGFTSYIYKKFGITLNRTSRAQFLQGDKVSVSNLRPGDLMFFSSRSAGRGNVGHVAMVVSVDKENGTCKFIHASTKRGVTYQTFPDNGYYSRNYLGARRILGTELDTSIEIEDVALN